MLQNMGRVLLTVTSTLLFSLSFPDGNLPHLVWIALVPWFFALRGAGPWKGFFIGFFYGLTIWLCAVWWLAGGLTGKEVYLGG